MSSENCVFLGGLKLSHLLSLRNIYKVYKTGDSKVYALKDVSLSIDKGEFVAIIGQSGSGKSTLMNILGCLDVPTKGDYILDNKSISELSDDQLSEIRNQKIGFIFQGFNLIPSLSAIENVELPLIYRGVQKIERRKLAHDSLCKVGLSGRLNHKPSEMSGGQQQRVAIARAITGEPAIILADEPTGNLDSKSGKIVMDILKNLNLEGKTIILITHDNKIAENADRIIKISDGNVISDSGKEIGPLSC